jgi:hypothetical protein
VVISMLKELLFDLITCECVNGQHLQQQQQQALWTSIG